MDPWVLGAIISLLGLIGLALASAAEDKVLQGLALFGFSVLFIFGLINRFVGR